ncbi:MAG: YgiQ family radical SAM protein [Ruminococcaceae bacterium]|nr:YgiQ family radical SAM protein [Oscillospiraceae bacterium]
MEGKMFLPTTKKEMEERGWVQPDFVYVSGDAYVDHPSFGASIITRVLEDMGFNVAFLAQPDFRSVNDFKRFGEPRLAFLVSAGNIDSMVAHYTVAKRKRNYDYYSPNGKMGLRPDRATLVYCKKIREAYPEASIILGGLEASLRRFGHYDYWDDTVMQSLLVDSGADILTYGMGENILRRIAELLDKGVPINKIRDVRGTVWLGNRDDKVHFEIGGSWDFSKIKNDKKEYAKAFAVQYKNQDSVSGKALIEYYGDKMLVQNPPMPPLTREELDEVYALPYMRDYHFSYKSQGGVPAIEEVKFSLTHNRGCFGGCNFCALAFHQGRSVRSRSVESVVEEAKLLTAMEDFKGYINDVGGPTANFREHACDKQLKSGVCADRKCLAPTPCKNLKADHSEYIELLSQIERLPKVKKVFIRSGIRFDYLLADKSPSGNAFFKKLVKDHVSGQLKVAPEHCSESVLKLMGKPDFTVYEKFRNRYFELTKSFNKEQYLVPYLMSSHPGSKLQDAIKLSEFIRKWNYNPEQVQDFYPTPGTASTVMFYTGLDPFTLNEVYVPRSAEEKRMQRALLQCKDPKNADLVRKALKIAHREDLIGHSKNCLVAPSYKDRVEKAKQNNKQNTRKNNLHSNNKMQSKRNTKGKKR